MKAGGTFPLSTTVVIEASSHNIHCQVARRHAEAWSRQLGHEKPNMRFVTGHIEYLDRAQISDASQDLVISNCVFPRLRQTPVHTYTSTRLLMFL